MVIKGHISKSLQPNKNLTKREVFFMDKMDSVAHFIRLLQSNESQENRPTFYFYYHTC